eukprot:CAMPEP_0119288424 /NCGR_PEP_ID=MMETSP1329-20130426/37251_1 /TAXON_ID=114041 /ORGANISM="Genus nov. species nov., Strain RCC1024" /LENGTH=65 /DNA_ID=CAMNT_0007289207 /DNA_START=41 /DNA_END=235 /DNA_ORIENTATION=+
MAIRCAVAALALWLSAASKPTDDRARAEYMRARKDGGWDAACERAYRSVSGARFAKLTKAPRAGR